MTAPAAIPMIHGDLDPFMPLAVVGVTNNRFVFRLLDGRQCAVTFVELCDSARLVALCGGDEAWLRRYFPTERRRFDGQAGAGRWVSTGLNAQVAAHFLADLCIKRESEMVLAAARTSPRRRWWNRLRDWLDRRFHLALAGLRPVHAAPALSRTRAS